VKQPKKPAQPKDPFNGAGHFVPRKPRKAVANPPKPRKSKPLFVVVAPEVFATIQDIRDAAAAAIARLDVLDVVAARKDFEWIRDVADQQLRAG
jgi:hypothetical protein